MLLQGLKPMDQVMAVPFLGVDFEFRRQGLGKQLMDVAREVAQQAKVKLLCLTIAEHNQAAQAFYSQYGFKEQQLVARGDSTRHVLYTMKPGSGDSSKAQGQGQTPSKKGGKRNGGGKPVTGAKRGHNNGKGFGVKACLNVAQRSCPGLKPGQPAGLGPRLPGCKTQAARPVIAAAMAQPVLGRVAWNTRHPSAAWPRKLVLL
ncbi:hypothetical protein V8C86DRAFT_2468330 [Haematococcus lacustris]